MVTATAEVMVTHTEVMVTVMGVTIQIWKVSNGILPLRPGN